MPELIYISPANTSINLGKNSGFVLTEAEGLTEAAVEISATTLATNDGAIINNALTQPRGIVLYLTVKQGANVEAVKREILGVIKPKQTGRLQWVQSDRTIEIEGTVEAVSMPRFVNGVVMQITLYCAQPYWQDLDYIVKQIELIDAMHAFVETFPQGVGIAFGRYNLDKTKTFTNYGDAAADLKITIIATGDIENPLLERADGKYFGILDTMAAGDSIVITTAKGKKSVLKNGVNIMSKVKEQSTWFQLETGANTFTISEAGGTGNMYFTFEYKQRYV